MTALSPAKRHHLLASGNETAQPYPSDRCVHELFEAQAARTPDAAALIYEDQTLSYGELNARANRLARYLTGLGAGPDARMALCVVSGFELMVGLLAILKAGGAYVPLDPTYPAERLGFMLADSAPVVVLTHSAGRDKIIAAMAGLAERPRVVDFAWDAQAWAEAPTDDIAPQALGLKSDHLAYVIYTSGSTGTPKGVMVEHRQLVARLAGMQARLSLGAQDLLPNLASSAFDISLLELIAPLTAGAAIQLLDGRRIAALDDLIGQTQAATCLHAVPSLMSAWSERLARGSGTQVYPRLRMLLVGGEAVPQHLLDRLAMQFPGVEVIELYGPTETTVICTTHASRPGMTAPHCIGRPLPNTRIYLLDTHGVQVARGLGGEIYVGGEGVARGYLNRPDLTAERFIASPFVDGDRLYRTGDLGRYLPDGEIEFLGRNDDQVKIRGFRIELGEIEARMAVHPGVGEVVVLAREDAPGDKRLVAYHTAVGAGVRAAELRAHLAGLLPEYMVPAAYVRLDALPLNLNGKIDRKALPAPGRSAYAAAAYAPPQGPVEEALARIWAEALGLETIGRQDNFFDLGGSSLMVVWMCDRLREQGFELPAELIFTTPILCEAASAMTP